MSVGKGPLFVDDGLTIRQGVPTLWEVKSESSLISLVFIRSPSSQEQLLFLCSGMRKSSYQKVFME